MLTTFQLSPHPHPPSGGGGDRSPKPDRPTDNKDPNQLPKSPKKDR